MESNNQNPFETPEMERAVLGCMMADYRIVDDALAILNADMFTVPAHRVVYGAIKKLNDAGKKVDLLTVSALLRTEKHDPNTDYSMEVINITAGVTSTALWEQYAYTVKQTYIKREFFGFMTAQITEMRNNASDVFDALDNTTKFITEVEQDASRGGDSIEPMDKLIIKANDEMLRRMDCYVNNKIIGIRTGSYEIDRKTLGWQGSQFIILGARPANGKTSFALHMAKTASKNGVPVVMFSYEMPKIELVQKLIVSESDIDNYNIKSGNLTENEYAKYIQAGGEIARLPLIIIDNTAMKIDDVRRVSKALYKRGKCGMVVIDYLQLIPPTDTKGIREQQVAYISRQCKLLAKELNIPVIALSQLSRGAEQNKIPMLSDLRESGALEQDADIVLFLRKNVELEGATEKTSMTVSIAKQRAGETGMIDLYCNNAMTRFSDTQQAERVQKFNSDDLPNEYPF